MDSRSEVSFNADTDPRGRRARGWFWACIAILSFVLAGAAVVLVWYWLQIPTNEELIAAFEKTSGEVDVKELSDDSLHISGIVICDDVPRDVWHAMVVRGQPTLVTLKGLRVSSTDWNVLGMSERLFYLRLQDCQFDSAVMTVDEMQSLETLEVWWSHGKGGQLTGDMLDVLIDSLPSAPGLTSLSVSYSEVTSAQLERLVQNAPQLERFGCYKTLLTEDCFQCFDDLDHLKFLTVDELPESATPVLAALPALRGISIMDGQPRVEQCIALFAAIDSLSHIMLQGTRFNEEQLAKFETVNVRYRNREDYLYLFRVDQ